MYAKNNEKINLYSCVDSVANSLFYPNQDLGEDLS